MWLGWVSLDAGEAGWGPAMGVFAAVQDLDKIAGADQYVATRCVGEGAYWRTRSWKRSCLAAWEHSITRRGSWTSTRLPRQPWRPAEGPGGVSEALREYRGPLVGALISSRRATCSWGMEERGLRCASRALRIAAAAPCHGARRRSSCAAVLVGAGPLATGRRATNDVGAICVRANANVMMLKQRCRAFAAASDGTRHRAE